MMEVQKSLKEGGYTFSRLNTDFGIRVKEYPEMRLAVLNYDQINSPKAHPIVMECRGLILDYDFNVVSRGFDRFFNLGEQPDTQAHLDWSKAVCYEKVDGSLIKIYCYNGDWYISTRGTAFAESKVHGFDITFEELVLKAMDVDRQTFQTLCKRLLCPDYTYICEVTSIENRVVKRYEGYNIYLLGIRAKTGEYIDILEGDAEKFIQLFWEPLFEYGFDSVEDCMKTVHGLKDLDEGFVIYQDGIPVCKVKSPAYVAVHHIRGEGLNPKRIMELVLINEQEEYLTYFPEDRGFFKPYVEALEQLFIQIERYWQKYRHIEVQKDFALQLQGLPFASVLFKARRDGFENWKEAWDTFTTPYKMSVLEKLV